MYLSEQLQKKWEGVLDHADLPKIADPYRKAVTAVVLENQAVEMQKSGQMLSETAPANSAGTGGFGGGAAAAPYAPGCAGAGTAAAATCGSGSGGGTAAGETRYSAIKGIVGRTGRLTCI